MTIYDYLDQIPLTFARVRNNARVSGLTVSVTVLNSSTGATLLASTSLPEAGSSGLYHFMWTHGIFAPTECLAVYTVGAQTYQEYFMISNPQESRTA